jgi:hypothetical protein
MTNHMRPGDIWRHKSMGRLGVTGEPGCPDGYLKCYWMYGCNPKDLCTCMDPTRTEHFTLVSRMVPD